MSCISTFRLPPRFCVHYRMLILAHVAGVRLLRSHAVKSVVLVWRSPGEHLEWCCNALIRVLLNSGSQQRMENIFTVKLHAKTSSKSIPNSWLTSSSAGR